MTIRRRIIAIVAVLSVACALQAAVALYCFANVTADVRSLTEESVPSLIGTGLLRADCFKLNGIYLRYLLATDVSQIDSLEQQGPKTVVEMRSTLRFRPTSLR